MAEILWCPERDKHGCPAERSEPEEEGPAPRQHRGDGRRRQRHDGEYERPGHRGGEADRDEQYEGHHSPDRDPEPQGVLPKARPWSDRLVDEDRPDRDDGGFHASRSPQTDPIMTSSHPIQAPCQWASREAVR